MHHNDTTSRSDRVLLSALAIVLATASAALGSALTYSRNPTQVGPIARKAAASTPKNPIDTVLSGLIAEHHCLSQVLYYEARGEGLAGQRAVAEVVFHRMNVGNYGHSICAVVYDGSGHQGCQFSFTCDGALYRPRDAAAWTQSERLAAQILTGQVRLRNATEGATYYHALWVSPYWAPTLTKTTQIGNHVFYRASRGRDS